MTMQLSVRFFTFLTGLFFSLSAFSAELWAPENYACELALIGIRFDMHSGEFLFSRNLDFKSWRMKQSPWVPDSSYAIDRIKVLPNAQLILERAFAQQSYYKETLTNKKLKHLTLESLSGALVKIPQNDRSTITLLKNLFDSLDLRPVYKNNLQIGNKWVLFINKHDDSLLVLTWPHWGATHNYIARSFLEENPDFLVVTGNIFVADIVFDSESAFIKSLSIKHINKIMFFDDILLRSTVSNEWADSYFRSIHTNASAFIDQEIISGIKKSNKWQESSVINFQ